MLLSACDPGRLVYLRRRREPRPRGRPSPRTPASPSARVAGTAAPGALEAAACAMPHQELLRVWRGTDPGRSGQIVIRSRKSRTSWDRTSRTRVPGTTCRTSRCSGSVRASSRRSGVVDRPVTIADIAPTQAALLDFEFRRPTGAILREIPRPRATAAVDRHARLGRRRPERARHVSEGLAGLAVADRRRRLVRERERRLEPSITPATHATIGTGAFPMRTGQTDAEFRIGPDLSGRARSGRSCSWSRRSAISTTARWATSRSSARSRA